MKKYEIRCETEGCGKTLGTVELPDDRPLTDQASGYHCHGCAKHAHQAAQADLAPERREALEAFRARMSAQGSASPKDLDELVEILFRK